MEEILESKKGKRTKFSPRVDLTPMVDLGFLLITFFVFTTSMATPKAMKLILPDDSGVDQPMPTSAEKTITLVLCENDKVFYYKGFLQDDFHKTDYKATGLRTVVNNMMADVAKKFGDRQLTTVIIKPTAEASYKNLVDALDEMLINDVTRYVVTEPVIAELRYIYK